MQSDQNASFRVHNKQSASKYVLSSLCGITSICIKHAIEKNLIGFLFCKLWNCCLKMPFFSLYCIVDKFYVELSTVLSSAASLSCVQ